MFFDAPCLYDALETANKIVINRLQISCLNCILKIHIEVYYAENI